MVWEKVFFNIRTTFTIVTDYSENIVIIYVHNYLIR